MLLMPGKTCDDGIKFFDNMQWGGLNDRWNAIPHVGSPDFAQMMNIAMLKYTEWTATGSAGAG